MPNVNIALDLFGLVVMLIVFFSCLEERTHHKPRSTAFFWMMGLIMLSLVADAVSWIGEGRPHLSLMTVIANAAASSAGYLTIFCYILYLRGNLFRDSRAIKAVIVILGILCDIAVITVIVNTCTGAAYTFDEHGHYLYSHDPWTTVSRLQFPLVALLTTLLMTLTARKIGARNRIFYILYLLFPTLGFLLDFFIHGFSLTYIGMVISTLLIYTNIYLQKRRVIAEQKNALMMSQINPHFMYNTLTAIASLCDISPKEAKALTVEFSTFLRRNLDTLTTTELIPFEQELEHVECYLKIEKARFRDKLNVSWSVDTQNFCLPALSIQPLVENAVRHGITKKADGGTVKISTWQDDSAYVVEIKDDGVGFDTEAAPDQTRTHIGIENVRRRLRDMCGGTLEVKSMTGVGTRVTMRIPLKYRRKA